MNDRPIRNPLDMLCALFGVVTMDQVSKNQVMAALISFRQENLALTFELYLENPEHWRFRSMNSEALTELGEMAKIYKEETKQAREAPAVPPAPVQLVVASK